MLLIVDFIDGSIFHRFPVVFSRYPLVLAVLLHENFSLFSLVLFQQALPFSFNFLFGHVLRNVVLLGNEVCIPCRIKNNTRQCKGI